MLQIIRANIAKLPFAVDVIVNSADTEPKYNFGVDRSIYLAAGSKNLLAARKIIGKIEIGDVQATDSFDLKDKAKKIFHAVAPIWSKSKSNVGKTAILRQCYQRAFDLASKNKYSSIACPILASGNNGLEIKEALQIAIEESLRFLFNHDSFEVYLVVLNKGTFDICRKVLPVKSYIKDKEAKALIAAEKAAGADQFRENQLSRPHVELKIEDSTFVKTLSYFVKRFRHPSCPERIFNLDKNLRYDDS
jgi:O-acetyl-ADP-ribose deacetylase (regulator of RNase III)